MRPPPGPARANRSPRPAPASRAANGRGSRFCPGKTCTARRRGPQPLLALAVPSDSQAQAWPPQQPAQWSSLGGKRPTRARRALLGACRVRGGVPRAPAGRGSAGLVLSALTQPPSRELTARAARTGSFGDWSGGAVCPRVQEDVPGIPWGDAKSACRTVSAIPHCGQETRIQRFTRGHSLQMIALGTAQRGGTMHATNQAACGAWERVLAPGVSQGRQQVLGEHTGRAGFLENPPFPEGSAGARLAGVSV